jgi:hypothetical protein
MYEDPKPEDSLRLDVSLTITVDAFCKMNKMILKDYEQKPSNETHKKFIQDAIMAKIRKEFDDS